MFRILMVLALSTGPHQLTNLTLAMAFPTRAACYAEAAARAEAIQETGTHGRYMCMRAHESDAGLAAEPKVDF